MSPAPMRLTAPLGCPSCGREFTGRWLEGRETSPQQCPSCGREFTATWPGFSVRPRIVVVAPAGLSGGGEHDEA